MFTIQRKLIFEHVITAFPKVGQRLRFLSKVLRPVASRYIYAALRGVTFDETV